LSYQVLARKWRPRDFSTLVGQAHVVRALSNGLDKDRLHHAFLFTGTRGVGKTTIARILAKSLNCLQGVSSSPCGECEHCVAIDEGRFVDLLEIDAASRTKVDDTREILDNVQYAPARGRYKVYLIDEVHMLSTHSFNALLKTLEEPPEHVKFVLATTDPQKIPITILSRCMQFNLRRLGIDEIAGQLKAILEAEGLQFELAALALLARAADGSMRDGLSLLDQALAAGGGRIELEAVEDMLGTVEQRHLHAILEALAEARPQAALAAVAEVFTLARDLSRLLADLAEVLHRIALIQQLPDYRDESRTDWDQLASFAAALDPEDVQLYYQIAVLGRRDLGLAPSIRSGCEMTLLRMFAFRPAGAAEIAVARPASRGDASSVREPTPASAPAGPEQRAAASPDEATEPHPAAPPRKPIPAASSAVHSPDDWASLLQSLDLNGPVRAVAAMMELAGHEAGKLEFRVARDDLGLLTERFRAQFSAALERHFDQPCRINFRPVDGEGALQTPAALAEIAQRERQSEAEREILEDPTVRRMQQEFGAEIIAGSVRPAGQGSFE